MKVYNPGNGQLYFFCPACNETHTASIDPEKARTNRDGSRPVWQWNQDTEKPTITPSVNYPGRCHFIITDGKIAYQNDCSHSLAGQTVELPDWRSDW